MEQEKKTLKNRILGTIRDKPKIGQKEMVVTLNTSPNNLAAYLGKLKKEGLIASPAYNQYIITNKGLNVLAFGFGEQTGSEQEEEDIVLNKQQDMNPLDNKKKTTLIKIQIKGVDLSFNCYKTDIEIVKKILKLKEELE